MFSMIVMVTSPKTDGHEVKASVSVVSFPKLCVPSELDTSLKECRDGKRRPRVKAKDRFDQSCQLSEKGCETRMPIFFFTGSCSPLLKGR